MEVKIDCSATNLKRRLKILVFHCFFKKRTAIEIQFFFNHRLENLEKIEAGMFKLAVIKAFVVVLCLSCRGEASILKSEDVVTTVLPEAIEASENSATEVSFLASLIESSSIQSEPEEAPVSTETITSDETPHVEVQNGSYFLLMMTILQDWTDEFMNKESDAFLQLSKKLGGELVDFIDNSQETSEINVTDFKLVEVRPSKDSRSSIYVTFVVSSKRELNGEDLSGALSSRILLYGEIYEHKVSIDGFSFKNISQEEAERDFGVQIMCESGSLIEAKNFLCDSILLNFYSFQLKTRRHSTPRWRKT